MTAAIDVVARALCNADEQRHRRLERRGDEPCRGHLDAAWVACEALYGLFQREILTASDLKHEHGGAGDALRHVYSLLTAQPEAPDA